MGGAQNDFSFETSNWGESIGALTSAHNDINEFADEMKDIVKQSLLQAGLSGDTAESLSETYDAEVLSSVRELDTNIQNFISQNQDNKDSADDLNAATLKVAQTVNIERTK